MGERVAVLDRPHFGTLALRDVDYDAHAARMAPQADIGNMPPLREHPALCTAGKRDTKLAFKRHAVLLGVLHRSPHPGAVFGMNPRHQIAESQLFFQTEAKQRAHGCVGPNGPVRKVVPPHSKLGSAGCQFHAVLTLLQFALHPPPARPLEQQARNHGRLERENDERSDNVPSVLRPHRRRFEVNDRTRRQELLVDVPPA